MRTRLPRLIVCANPSCEKVKDVRKLCEQKKRRFCSQSCANAVNRNLSKEACSRGGKERARRIRLRFRERIAEMTRLECFRYGYRLGLESKTRQLQNRRPRMAA